MDDAAAQRFWSKVRVTPHCWEWLAGRSTNGYGQFTIRTGVNRSAHRLAYESVKGAIPPGMGVRHRCDNRACVNPAHLELGTQADNMRDMHERGRARTVRGERHGSSRLTPSAVQDILASQEPGTVLADRYGVTKAHVSNIRLGKRWAHVKGESE